MDLARLSAGRSRNARISCRHKSNCIGIYNLAFFKAGGFFHAGARFCSNQEEGSALSSLGAASADVPSVGIPRRSNTSNNVRTHLDKSPQTLLQILSIVQCQRLLGLRALLHDLLNSLAILPQVDLILGYPDCVGGAANDARSPVDGRRKDLRGGDDRGEDVLGEEVSWDWLSGEKIGSHHRRTEEEVGDATDGSDDAPAK